MQKNFSSFFIFVLFDVILVLSAGRMYFGQLAAVQGAWNFSASNQGAGVILEKSANFTVSSFFQVGIRLVSLEVFADGVDSHGVREAFLSGSLDVNSGFGFTSDSIYFSRLALPDGALQILADGKKILLNVDLSAVQDFRGFRRVNGGTLSEITDPSVLPSQVIHFAWELGDAFPTYGGKIQSFYQRPDGEWARSLITNIKRQAIGTGEAFGLQSSSASVNRSEYTEEGNETSVSSAGVFPPVVFFPRDPSLPEEP